MQTDDRLGTFDEIAALFPSESARIATALRSLIVSLDGDTFEVPRLGEKATTYGVGPSKMKQAYCYIMPQRGYVNLGFFHGARLADPAKTLGTGKSILHVKVRSEPDVARTELSELVRAAIAERRDVKAMAEESMEAPPVAVTPATAGFVRVPR